MALNNHNTHLSTQQFNQIQDKVKAIITPKTTHRKGEPSSSPVPQQASWVLPKTIPAIRES